MSRKAFDAYDLAVYEAHVVADCRGKRMGLVRTWELQRYHDGPLAGQRLSGMARRGLLTYDGFRWGLTDKGLRLADEYRKRGAA